MVRLLGWMIAVDFAERPLANYNTFTLCRQGPQNGILAACQLYLGNRLTFMTEPSKLISVT